MIPYKLRDWIGNSKLEYDWTGLSKNPHAIQLLEKNPDKIDWNALSCNPSPLAIHLLEKYTCTCSHKFNWARLSSNPHAIHILEKNFDKIHWDGLSANPSPFIVRLFEKYSLHTLHSEKIDWYILSKNPSPAAIHLLEQNIDKIHWCALFRNENPLALHLIEKRVYWWRWWQWKNPEESYIFTIPKFIEGMWKLSSQNPGFFLNDSLDWRLRSLSQNPYAVHILEENLLRTRAHALRPGDRIIWNLLCTNPSPLVESILEKYPQQIDWRALATNTSSWAMRLFEKNPDKIDWSMLSRNSSPFAIRILEKNRDKINWYGLSINTNAIHLMEEIYKKNIKEHGHSLYLSSSNPAIFTYDYAQMKETKHALHEELIRTMNHPKYLPKFKGWGFESGYDSESDNETLSERITRRTFGNDTESR